MNSFDAAKIGGWKWIEAAARIAEDPEGKVPCPKCGKANLEVVSVDWSDRSSVDRYLSCPVCRARNVLTAPTEP